MMFVLCPTCEARVEIFPEAFGPDRTDLYNVDLCPECGTSFDYDDEEVQFEPTESSEHRDNVGETESNGSSPDSTKGNA